MSIDCVLDIQLEIQRGIPVLYIFVRLSHVTYIHYLSAFRVNQLTTFIYSTRGADFNPKLVFQNFRVSRIAIAQGIREIAQVQNSQILKICFR